MVWMKISASPCPAAFPAGPWVVTSTSRCGQRMTADLTDVVQPDPEHSPPTPCAIEMTMLEPYANGELLLGVSMEPVMTVSTNVLEPKPQHDSDQGCELATAIPVGILVDLDTGEDFALAPRTLSSTRDPCKRLNCHF